MSTANELIDIIDDDGRTIGVTTRADIRARRLPHRCTYVLVFNKHGELFIHLRTATKDVYPSRWDVAVGGVVLAGETFDQGARREILEELGIDAEARPLFPFAHTDDHGVVRAMVYRLDHGGPFQLQPEEIVRGEWATLAEVWRRVAAQSFCPDGLEVLRQMEAKYHGAG
jgi:isopentenyldiphosphate isomerase